MKKQLLSLLLMLPAAVWAQQQWTIVDQGGHAFALDSVTCLLASDTEEAFTIVLNNGNLQTGVTEATFKKQDLSAIQSATATPSAPTLALEARTRLVVSGCAEGTPLRLYNAGGQLLRSGQVSAGSSTVDVASLPAGVYIIKVGECSIKFHKK